MSLLLLQLPIQRLERQQLLCVTQDFTFYRPVFLHKQHSVFVIELKIKKGTQRILLFSCLMFFPSSHLERPWGDIAVFSRPQLLDKLGIGSGNLSFHAQRVVFIQLICVLVFEEVLRQWRNIA